ncbi:hypothetical protein BD289DRAFT_479886 [Coniella lustricola]|uniref:Clr5 domain-containing protein n=1 Tax=Coniella lustricola TaxID=2025994 RepID=A0A2T3AHP3_9PEZI|nr:hypothetical protein BD289DRAFT_479886 [Coniella lustricola]
MSVSMAAADLSRGGGSGGGGGRGRGRDASCISPPQRSPWDSITSHNYSMDVSRASPRNPPSHTTARTVVSSATASPTTSGTPAPTNSRQRKASAATETMVLRGLPASTEWETHKATIHELYMDRNLNLIEVVERMRVYDFHATARMYKTQFARWGWSKYNCKRLRRDISSGKTVVKAQGKSCHRVKRQRAKKRVDSSGRSSSWPSTPSSSESSSSPAQSASLATAATPSHYEEASLSPPASTTNTTTVTTSTRASTPPAATTTSIHTAQLSLPAHVAHANDTNRFMQSILTDIRNHVYQVFSHKPSWHQSRTTRIGLINAYEYTSYDHFVLALDAFTQRAHDEGGQILRQAFVDVEAAIQRDYSATFYFLFVDLPDLFLHYGRHDILTILLGHIKRLTSPGAMRLRERISGAGLAALHALAETEPAALRHYISTASGLWCDLLEELRGPRDRSTLLAKRNYLRHDRGADQRYRVGRLCEDYVELLGGVQQQFGHGHTMSHHMEDVVLSTQLVHDYFVDGFVEQNERLAASLENKYRLGCESENRPPPLYGTARGGGLHSLPAATCPLSTTPVSTSSPASPFLAENHHRQSPGRTEPVQVVPVAEWDVLDRHIRSNCFHRLAYYYHTAATSPPRLSAQSTTAITTRHLDNGPCNADMDANYASLGNDNLALAKYYNKKALQGWHTDFWQLEAETSLVAAGRHFEAQSLRRCRLEAQYFRKLPENDRARIAWVRQVGGTIAPLQLAAGADDA